MIVIATIHVLPKQTGIIVLFVLVNLLRESISLSQNKNFRFFKQNRYRHLWNYHRNSHWTLKVRGDIRKIWKNYLSQRLVKSFIPTDILVHWKIDSQDTDVSGEIWSKFSDLWVKYSQIISSNADNSGHTYLVTMDIDTRDNLLILQRPYNLTLKCTTWLHKEQEMLQKMGPIVWSVSPGASPIVVLLKQTQLGEPSRLCADYRAINNLLPPLKGTF